VETLQKSPRATDAGRAAVSRVQTNAEVARKGYQTGKWLDDTVVKERKLLTQKDGVFWFADLMSPEARAVAG